MLCRKHHSLVFWRPSIELQDLIVKRKVCGEITAKGQQVMLKNKSIPSIRYDAAILRKTKTLDTIRALELPNNPLDDIIDQVSSSNSL